MPSGLSFCVKESILQFGGGKFLRAFTDLFVEEMNQSGDPVGRVVVVQSSDSPRAQSFNNQSHYHVLIRGLHDGEVVDETRTVVSVSRALVANRDWAAALDVARSGDLRWIVSNTTEAGLALDADEVDPNGDATPRSFPAKLASVLFARYESGALPIHVLPCELVDRNGDLLGDLVLQQARAWGYDRSVVDWFEDGVVWSNTLVDRIVSVPPRGHPLEMDDALLCAAEPFATWAIESKKSPFPHPDVRAVDQIDAFSLRKVRILNGAHTALVQKALGQVETVLEAMEDPTLRGWLEALMMEEIVPVVEDRVEDAAGFVRTTLERFSNPHLHHRLSDIALHQEEKVRVRLVPTYEEFVHRFGRKPARLSETLDV